MSQFKIIIAIIENNGCSPLQSYLFTSTTKCKPKILKLNNTITHWIFLVTSIFEGQFDPSFESPSH